MGNKELKDNYNAIYRAGAYESFYSFSNTEEMLAIASSENWSGKKIFEIGSGEGDLAALISMCGGTVLAVDYAESAIEIAKSRYSRPNLEFRCCDYKDISQKFDIVVMQGVLEHLDDPFNTLKILASEYIDKGGKIITSSPSFLNPRGYIWMALQLLLDVPMSLSDLHFLCPFDFEQYAQLLGAQLTYASVDQDWGHGKRLIIDLDKRLRNAFRDRGLPANVDRFIDWLSHTLKYTSYTQFSGCNVIYKFMF
jgi:SAM-dependent methyltransferase